MDDIAIVLDPGSQLSLQQQLRQKIIDAIQRGVLGAGRRLPSSRQLARQLDISRNTVALAYDALVAEGHLAARQRSGVFVAAEASSARIVGRRRQPAAESLLASSLPPVRANGGFRCPHNWQQYPYPFIDGRIDPQLLPLTEWREAIRLACSRRDALNWSASNGELDDAMLLEELRTKILPERGIDAAPHEMLLTVSARHALQMLAELLIKPGMPVWLEEPVDADFVQTLRERKLDIGRFDPTSTAPLPEGVVIVTSARHGIESGSRTPRALLKAIRARHGILIEQDTPADVLEVVGAAPALCAASAGGAVIYIGSLSPTVSCGVPPAVTVASAPVIERLRQLRRMSGAVPEFIQQRAWAYFIALGHYAASLRRVRRILGERRTALRDALNHYLHQQVVIETLPGTSTYWVRCNEERDTDLLAREAAGLGVLIRPGRLPGAQNAFGMGVTGITLERIRPGVRNLARLIRGDLSHGRRKLADDGTAPLTDTALRRAMAGKTLLYSTVYGEPCTIEMRRNGEMVGVAGHAQDDRDQGHWWIEGDRWFRQWRNWAYGEVYSYAVVVEGDQIRWYDEDGLFADRAVLMQATPRRS
ncbi:MAG: PLP-dependent aminotransferase family protein [Rhodanobacter sp.]